MTIYEELKQLEKNHRKNGRIEVANRLKKLLRETPKRIGKLEVFEDGESD